MRFPPRIYRHSSTRRWRTRASRPPSWSLRSPGKSRRAWRPHPVRLAPRPRPPRPRPALAQVPRRPGLRRRRAFPRRACPRAQAPPPPAQAQTPRRRGLLPRRAFPRRALPRAQAPPPPVQAVAPRRRGLRPRRALPRRALPQTQALRPQAAHPHTPARRRPPPPLNLGCAGRRLWARVWKSQVVGVYESHAEHARSRASLVIQGIRLRCIATTA
mmetsp:Transcript_61437/g.187640  ORF Transcript_61437/g.187640 Transcript_61437/m.187640 type:complete len:215 (-) Transcript_61437:393-1037(-)